MMNWARQRFFLYFKVLLKLWTGSQAAYGILQLGAVDVKLDFPSPTSTPC